MDTDEVLVDTLVAQAQAAKAEIEQSQSIIKIHQEAIKKNRHRLKALNPLIALYDGTPVELPEMDLRTTNGERKPRKAKAEPTSAPKRRKPAKRKSNKGKAHAAVKWEMYPDTCLLPTEYHRVGQRQEHIGRGLCNAHVQRLRLGSMPEEEMAEYVKAAQAFAKHNGFTLTEDELRLS